jgi:hypothetical protein
MENNKVILREWDIPRINAETQRLIRSSYLPKSEEIYNGEDLFDEDNVDKLECLFETKLLFYIVQALPILDEYRKTSKKNNSSFFSKVIDSDDFKAKLILICGQFVSVNGTLTERSNVKKCENCGISFNIYSFDECVCQKCALVTNMIDISPSFKDTNRINMSNSYRYTPNFHFYEAIEKFEAKQPFIKNEEEVMGLVRKQMSNHKIEKNFLTKDQLFMILCNNRLSSYNEDINYIHYKITGIQPPDLSEYKELLALLNVRVSVYHEEIKKETGRKYSLLSMFVLCQLLILLKSGYGRKDFFMLKTKSKEDDHMFIWNKILYKMEVDLKKLDIPSLNE